MLFLFGKKTGRDKKKKKLYNGIPTVDNSNGNTHNVYKTMKKNLNSLSLK